MGCFHLPSDEPQRCLTHHRRGQQGVADEGSDEWTSPGWARHGTGYRFPGTQLDDDESPPEGFRCRLDGSGRVGQLTGSHGIRSTVPVLSNALLCHYHKRKQKMDPAMLLELARGLHNGSITEIVL